ncbi:hypothetical protein [Plantactinospora sp. GCM10030261]|uniref:hypothetical protein n=1 Tax=Plantactinospora sp. GCM10030261 TaxID=3273420 RepID=UPI003608ADDF
MTQPPYPPSSGQPQGGPYQPPQYPSDQYGGGPQYGGGNQPYGGAPQQGGPQYGGGNQPYGAGPDGQPYGGDQRPGDPAQSYGNAGPAYGPPGPGGTGAPGGGPGAPEQPKKKSKAGKIVLFVLIGLLVVCGGGGAAIYFAVKDDVENVVEAAKTTVTAPDTLAGRPKSTDPDLVKAAQDTEASINKDVTGATGTVAAFYGDPEEENLLMIAAVSGRVPDPDKQVERDIEDAGTQGMAITDVKSVDPGPLGGVAKCGDSKLEGIQLGVCIWADAGSSGMVVTYGKTADQAATEFVQIRGEIEKRS